MLLTSIQKCKLWHTYLSRASSTTTLNDHQHPSQSLHPVDTLSKLCMWGVQISPCAGKYWKHSQTANTAGVRRRYVLTRDVPPSKIIFGNCKVVVQLSVVVLFSGTITTVVWTVVRPQRRSWRYSRNTSSVVVKKVVQIVMRRNDLQSWTICFVRRLVSGGVSMFLRRILVWENEHLDLELDWDNFR